MQMSSMQELYIHKLKDLYSAETQITQALPQMIERMQSPQLKEGMQRHLEQTQQQVQRLEQIMQKLGEQPGGVECKGMKGLLQEGQELMQEASDPEVLEAGLIAAQQAVEHYEIAGYGTARTYAQLLGDQEAAQLLEQTLQEESQTDEQLTQIAQQINLQAMQS